MAQLGCVPALFSVLFLLSLLSHPPWLLEKELLEPWSRMMQDAGEVPKGTSGAVLGMMLLRTPQGCSVQPGDLTCHGAVEGHPARSGHIAGALS